MSEKMQFVLRRMTIAAELLTQRAAAVRGLVEEGTQ
jgi:hypothetical protein